MRPAGIVGLITGLALGLALPAVVAVEEQSWTREGAGFRAGQLEGMQVTPAGRLVPAPARVELGRPAEGVLWDAAFSRGRLVVAAGDPARVLVYGRPGQPAVEHFLPDGGQAFALAPGKRDVLYVATGPRGAVYRLDLSTGDVREIYRPRAEYIWDLLLLPSGALLVATGLPGTVVRVDPAGGEVEPLWESQESHVRCLAAGGGRILAGTSDSGWIVELRPQGDAFVLWDSDRAEVSALAVGPSGSVWAAFSGSREKADGSSTSGSSPREKNGGQRVTTTITVRARAEDAAGSNGKDKKSGDVPASAAASPAGGEVVRIDPDGLVRRVWSDGKQTPLALSSHRGGVLVATASPARVLWIDGEGREGLWLEQDEVRSLAALARDGERMAVAGNHPALVLLWEDAVTARARWTSDVFDAGSAAVLGRVRVVTAPEGAARWRVEARSGNTRRPDAGWSAWVEVPGAAGPPTGDGGAAPLNRARFAQVRVSSEDPPAGAGIDRVAWDYRPVNRPPRVEQVEALPLGVAYRPVPPSSITSGETPVVSVPHAAEVRRALKGKSRNWRSKKVYEAGALTLRWSAGDPDGDRLEYRLEFCRDRGGACRRWQVLAEELTRNFFSFDSRTLPDGVYRFRVTATDRGVNPLGEERSHSRISGPVVIDHHPPTIVEVTTTALAQGEGVEVRVRASDPGGRLARAEIAVAGGRWLPLAATDGVADGAEESFAAGLGQAPPKGGLAVRVTDQAGNVSTWRSE
ncbi:MAG: hypothetical protein Q9Q40_11410 [Acidobacteriota bacterium]|nr:hypothetical protein [Acidobacteriota bacterium]